MSRGGKINGMSPSYNKVGPPLQQPMSYGPQQHRSSGGPQPPRPTYGPGAAYNHRYSAQQPYPGQPRQSQQQGMYPGQLPPSMGGRSYPGGGGGYSPYGYQGQSRREDVASGVLNGLTCCLCLDLCFF